MSLKNKRTITVQESHLGELKATNLFRQAEKDKDALIIFYLKVWLKQFIKQQRNQNYAVFKYALENLI